MDSEVVIAERVRALMAASGLSQGVFAERVGLDNSKLSKSLSGTRRFTSLDLARIADVTQVSVDSLLHGESTLAMAARTSGNASAATAIKRARRLVELRQDAAFLGLRQSWQPVAAAVTGSTSADAAALADAAHARLAKVGRSVLEADLADVLETSFGVDVAVEPLGDSFDGLAVAGDDARLILLGCTDVIGRQRFTMAHELAHLLAGDDQELHVDPDIYQHSHQQDPTERRANAFAAAFLMPAPVLTDAVPAEGLSELGFAELVCRLRVSPTALAIRLADLRLITNGTKDRWRRLSALSAARQADRTMELAQNITLAQQPRRPAALAADLFHAYESGRSTLRPYANLMELDVEELSVALEAPDPTSTNVRGIG